MMAMLAIGASPVLKELGYTLLLQIHDEVILEGPEATAELAQEAIRLTGDPTAIRWMRTIALDPTD